MTYKCSWVGCNKCVCLAGNLCIDHQDQLASDPFCVPLSPTPDLPAVMVSQMEWDKHPDQEDFYAFMNDGGNCLYMITNDVKPGPRWRLFIGGECVPDPDNHEDFAAPMVWDDPEDAKAYAQDDLDGRLRRIRADKIKVSVLTMVLSGNREEYYVQINCGGRTIETRRFSQGYRNRADYEADELRHVLLNDPKPDLLDPKYADPAQPIPSRNEFEAPTARDEALREAAVCGDKWFDDFTETTGYSSVGESILALIDQPPAPSDRPGEFHRSLMIRGALCIWEPIYPGQAIPELKVWYDDEPESGMAGFYTEKDRDSFTAGGSGPFFRTVTARDMPQLPMRQARGEVK